MKCPFKLGEIAIIESYIRGEIYITTILQAHIDEYGSAQCPTIKKATLEEKKMWYYNDSHELVLESIKIK